MISKKMAKSINALRTLVIASIIIGAWNTLADAPDESVFDVYTRALSEKRGPEMKDAVVQVMTNHPPMVLVRSSKVGQPGSNLGLKAPEGCVELGCYLKQLVRYLYDLDPHFPQNRILVPHDLVRSRYDFVNTMAAGGWETLKQDLKDRYGLTIRRENRSNLVLKVKNPSAEGLHKHVDASSNAPFRSTDVTMQDLAKELSTLLGVSVTDQTGLSGGFDFTLDFPNPSTPEDINKVVLAKLGLELNPADDNKPVEFIVVERTQ